MKILAALFASCLVAMPVYAQGDPPADTTGKPAQGAPPAEGERPAEAGDPAGKPAASTTEPEPDEAPEGATPDKPADPPEA